jgi:SAM-dependent methyltransferase
MAYGGDPSLDRLRSALTYRRLVSRGRPRSVLEVGFGTGGLLRRFIDDGAQVYGVDADQLGVDVDRQVMKRGHVFRGPIEEINIPREVVDLAYGVHVIEHVADIRVALGAMARALRPGGRIHLITPTAQCRELDVFGVDWWMLEDPTHLRFFSPASARRALELAGFEGVEVRRLVLDSVSSPGGSLTRRVRGTSRSTGVLSTRLGLTAGLATAPAVIGARLVDPRWRSTLEVTAVRSVPVHTRKC